MTPSGVGEGGTQPHPSQGSDPRRLRLVRDDSEVGPAARASAPALPNLPVALSSLVGREREIEELGRLLNDTRLLTITGTGGCGKTRLAMALARDVAQDFEDGARWVGLASLSDPDLVPQLMASVLGTREEPGRALTDTLMDYLEQRRLLLILDNCEHLIESCAALAGNLLRSCPGLKILATSREALGIAGERTWTVPSLTLPDPHAFPTSIEEFSRYEAVGLFVERASAATSTFALTDENAADVTRVCRRLDGIPLAIELAAARTRVLSAEQILERLEDSLRLLAGADRSAPERHRTLRGALDWSYELLEDAERSIFRRLAVFAGGWTLEAAETVGTGGGIGAEEILDLLSGLVEKSLVAAAAGAGALRYRMLEPVRQYGLERLEAGGEAERVRDGHARYYLALAEKAETELELRDAWLEQLEAEYPNFLAALSWTLDQSDARLVEERAEIGLRLATALAQGRFWNAYGPSEGRRWLERGLYRSSASPESVRAKALSQAGWIATHQGDYPQAVALLEESMSLFDEVQDYSGFATSLVHLGHMAVHWDDRERVRTLSREAEKLRQELKDPQAIAWLLYFLGIAALSEGDRDRAEALLEESLALNSRLGNQLPSAVCLTVLGISALERRDPERAAVRYREDMRLLRGLRDKTGIAYGLLGMAGVAALRGEAARAARMWGAAETVREAIRLPLSAFDRDHPDYEGIVAVARSQLKETAWEQALAEGRAMGTQEALEYALAEEEHPRNSVRGDSVQLSDREVEVLRLVAEGLTDAQVANRLYLSPRTVGQHLRSIYRKLGVPSRAAAARAAVERSLI